MKKKNSKNIKNNEKAFGNKYTKAIHNSHYVVMSVSIAAVNHTYAAALTLSFAGTNAFKYSFFPLVQ